MASAADIKAAGAFVDLYLKDRMTQALASTIKSAGQSLQSLGESVIKVGAGIAAGAALITAPIMAGVGVFAEMGKEAMLTSQRTGLSVEAVSELGFAARRSGMDMGGLEVAFRNMAKNVTAFGDQTDKADAKLDKLGKKTAKGGKGMFSVAVSSDTEKEVADPGMVAAFGQLGISLEQIQSLNPEKQFELIASRLGAVQNQTEKTSLALKIFGRSGMQILPLLNDVGKLRDEARRLGLTMSTEDAQAAKDLSGAFSRLKEQGQQIFFQIGAAVAGPLTAFAQQAQLVVKQVIDFARANRPLIETVGTVAKYVGLAGAGIAAIGTVIWGAGAGLSMLAGAISGVSRTAMSIGNFLLSPFRLLGSVASGAAGMISTAFTRAGTIVQGAFSGVAAGARFFAPVVAGAVSAGAAVAGALARAGVSAGGSLVSSLSSAAVRIGPALAAGIVGFPSAARTVFATATAYVTSFVNGWTGTLALSVVQGGQQFNRLGAAAQATFSRIGQYGSAVWSLVSGAAQAAFPTVISAAQSAYAAVISGAQRAAGAIGSAWNQISESAQFTWRAVQWSAAGAVMQVQGVVGSLVFYAAEAWGKISGTWQAAVTRIGAVLSPVTARISSVWASMSGGLQSAATASAGAIAGAYGKLPAWVRGPLGQLATLAREDAGRVTSALGGAFGRVGTLARGAAVAAGAALAAVGPLAARGLSAAMTGAFAGVRAAATATGGFLRRAMTVTPGAIGKGIGGLGKGLGGVAGGLLGAAGMVGAMGIGGPFTALLAAAPMVMGVLAPIGGAIAALASPVMILTAAVAGGVAAWVLWSSSGQSAWAELMAAVMPIVATLQQTFGGVKDAILAGDWAGAGQIAIAGLKVALLQGLGSLEANFGETFATILQVVGKAGDWIVDAWHTVTAKLSSYWDEWGKGTLDTILEIAGLIPDIWQKAVEQIGSIFLELGSANSPIRKGLAAALGPAGAFLLDQAAKAAGFSTTKQQADAAKMDPEIRRRKQMALGENIKMAQSGLAGTATQEQMASMGVRAEMSPDEAKAHLEAAIANWEQDLVKIGQTAAKAPKTDVLAGAKESVRQYAENLRVKAAESGQFGTGAVSKSMEGFLTGLRNGTAVAGAQSELTAAEMAAKLKKLGKDFDELEFEAAGPAPGEDAPDEPPPKAAVVAAGASTVIGPTFSAAAAAAAGFQGSGGGSLQEQMVSSLHDMRASLEAAGMIAKDQFASNLRIEALYEKFVAAMNYT